MRTLRTKEYWLTQSCQLLLRVCCFVALSATVGFGQSARSEPSATLEPAQTTTPPRPNMGAPLVINTDLVSVTVSVTDRDGRHVSGLDKGDFTVYDDQLPQEIKFFSDADTPVSLAVIFDTSNSMSGDKIRRARVALANFVKNTHREDEYFLISFSDHAQLLLDRTRDADAMLAKFTYVKPRGETALYDATYLGVEKVLEGSRSRRAILLITDGNDTCSRYTFKELRRSLKESDVVLYAIGILAFSRSEARIGRNTLKELASVTGGKAFFPDGQAEIAEAFERIALELRSHYSIGYRPTDLTGDRRWHRIKVNVNPQGMSRPLVRNREGYYAPR